MFLFAFFPLSSSQFSLTSTMKTTALKYKYLFDVTNGSNAAGLIDHTLVTLVSSQ